VFLRFEIQPEGEKWFSSGIFAPKYGLREKNGFQAVFFAPKYGLREKNGFQAVTRPDPFYCLPQPTSI
ncbi:MAG: hypothetical protein IIZ05_04595, partial [Firmicutes bacterium]|nr:hypothetical protein [Bacillota bacterium]